MKVTGIQPEVCSPGTHLIPWDYSKGCIVDGPVICQAGFFHNPQPGNYYTCSPVVQDAPQPLPTLDGWGLLVTVCAVALAGVWRAAQ